MHSKVISRWNYYPFKLAAFAFEFAAQAIIAFLLITAVARLFPLDLFGAFAFVIAVASLQQNLAPFGLQQLLYGRSAGTPSSPSPLLWSATAVTVWLSLGLYSATLLLFSAYDHHAAILYGLAGLRVLAAVSLPLTTDAQARHAIGEYIPLRATTLALAGVLTGLAWIKGADIAVFAAIFGLEPFAYAILLAASASARRRLKRPPHPRYRKLIRTAAPIAFQSAMVAIYYRFDQVYVQFRFGPEALGIYAGAARVAELGNMVWGVLVLLVAPRLIREIWNPGGLSRPMLVTLFFIGLATAVASLFALAFGGWGLGLMFGREFSTGGSILAVYLLSAAFVAYGALAARALSSNGQTMAMAVSGLAGAATNVVAVVVFCELMGPIGAAWGTVLAYGVAAAIVWWAVLRSKPVWTADE